MAVRDEGSSLFPPGSDNTLLSFARDHFTLLVSVVAGLLFALRCIAVSNNNIYIVYILVAQTTLGDALRALIFSAVPPLLLGGSLVLAVLAGLRGQWYEPRPVFLMVTSILANLVGTYLFGSFTQNWAAFILTATVALLAYGMGVAFRSEPRTPLRLIIIYAGLIALLSLIVPTLISQRFWLPPERLVFKGESPFTGYVLKSEEDRFVILNDHPRIVIEKPKADLAKRDFCYPDSQDFKEAFKAAGRVISTCP